MDTLTAIAVRNIGKRLKDINADADGATITLCLGLHPKEWRDLVDGNGHDINLRTLHRAADYFKCSVEDLLSPGKLSYIDVVQLRLKDAKLSTVIQRICPGDLFGNGHSRIGNCPVDCKLCTECWDRPAPIEYQKGGE